MPYSVFTAGNSTAENAGKVRRVFVDAAHTTLIAPGDLVRATGSADTEGTAAVDALSATGQQVFGVVASVDYRIAGENLSRTGLPAGQPGYLYVQTDPTLWLEANVVNGPLLVTDVGLNVDSTFTPATATGLLDISNMAVNATGKATTATLQLRVQQLLPDANGVLGNRALVSINNQSATGV